MRYAILVLYSTIATLGAGQTDLSKGNSFLDSRRSYDVKLLSKVDAPSPTRQFRSEVYLQLLALLNSQRCTVAARVATQKPQRREHL